MRQQKLTKDYLMVSLENVAKLKAIRTDLTSSEIAEQIGKITGSTSLSSMAVFEICRVSALKGDPLPWELPL